MRPPIITPLLFIAAATPSTSAAAQEIAPETRVMITLTPQRQVEGYTPDQVLRGTLLSMSADSLTLRIHPATTPVSVARTAVRRMYVSRGVPSRAASAARGAVGGAIVGALYLWLNHDDGDFDSDAQAAWVGAAGGGVVGLVGGALFPRERWHRVRIPRGVSVAPAAGGGAALGVSIAR